jgi:glycosyltransferase involved in cell wall biosynthesis
MKNVTLVSQVFHPNTQSTSLLLTDLVLNLRDSDTNVSVICGFPNGVDNDVVERNEVFEGIGVNRCGINVNLKSGLGPRLVSYVSYLLHAGWKLLFVDREEIILGVTNPPFLAILLAIVSLMRGTSYYYIMHDVYPEGLVAVGKLKEESLATKLWRKLNQLSYRRASKIVVLGRDMKDLLIQNYGVRTEQIEYIPNWSLTTTDLPTRFAENKMAIDLGIQDKFIVQYSGNMGLWHDIDTFVQAAAKLQNNSHIQFLFIGNGMRQRQAQQLSQELELNNIIWMDFVPTDKLNISLTCAHIALISLNSGLEGIAVPCKLYGILGSGRAILAQVPVKSEIAYVIQEENCGFVVVPGDVNGLVDKIELLSINPQLTSEMGANAFNAYKNKYTSERVASQFQQLLGL